MSHFPRPDCFSEMTLGPQPGFYGEATHGTLLSVYVKNNKISCGLALAAMPFSVRRGNGTPPLLLLPGKIQTEEPGRL